MLCCHTHVICCFILFAYATGSCLLYFGCILYVLIQLVNVKITDNVSYFLEGMLLLSSRKPFSRVYDVIYAAGDSMSYNNGAAFSTKDRDNDKASYNCASSHVKGAWWFEDCSWAYLNGVYLSDGSPRTKRYDGITWYHWLGMYRSLQRTEMKIRP